MTTIVDGVSRSFHQLLPTPTVKKTTMESPEEFNENIKKSGIIRIAFLRCGMGKPLERKLDYRKALNDPAPIYDTEAIDCNRPLSRDGKSQARLAGQSFGIHVLPPYFPEALVSPAYRGLQTAEIFLAKAGVAENLFSVTQEPGKVMIKTTEDLYERMIINLGYDTDMIDLIPEGHEEFERLGDRPLIEYLVPQFKKQKMNIIRKVLGEYGYHTLERINHLCCLDTSQNWGSGGVNKGTLLVISHKVYLQAAALALASYTGCPEDTKEFILNARVRPADCILIDIEKHTAELLERPLLKSEKSSTQDATSKRAEKEKTKRARRKTAKVKSDENKGTYMTSVRPKNSTKKAKKYNKTIGEGENQQSMAVTPRKRGRPKGSTKRGEISVSN
jgi:broad specificity phosphatase PhoE